MMRHVRNGLSLAVGLAGFAVACGEQERTEPLGTARLAMIEPSADTGMAFDEAGGGDSSGYTGWGDGYYTSYPVEDTWVEDWSGDSDTSWIDYRSESADDTDLDRWQVETVIGRDPGPLGLGGGHLSVTVPIFGCKDIRQDCRLVMKCRVFGICVSRRGCQPRDCPISF